MANPNLLSGLLIDNEEYNLSIQDLCHAIHSETDFVFALIEHGVITPKGSTPETWRFNHIHIKRARIAASFQRDLHINLSGINLALDLLERIDRLESQLMQRVF